MSGTNLYIAVLVLSCGLVGCASISENECLAGAWSDIGYQDGVNGRQKGKLADYAEDCARYAVAPDRQAYLQAYDQGLMEYCTYSQGLELGEGGKSFNQACSGHLSNGFAQGYEEGRLRYAIYQEHTELVADYEDVLETLVDVRARLAGDIGDKDDNGSVVPLDTKQTERLIKRQYRLEGELDDLRRDIREFEHANQLPRYQL